MLTKKLISKREKSVLPEIDEDWWKPKLVDDLWRLCLLVYLQI